MVSEIFFIFLKYESVGANDPQGMAKLDPRAIVGRIYVRDH